MTKDNISKDIINFASFKKIQIDNIDIFAQRLSYVGENGFELYMDINNSKKIFNLIMIMEKNLIYLYVVCMH